MQRTFFSHEPSTKLCVWLRQPHGRQTGLSNKPVVGMLIYGCLRVASINPLKPSGYYIYHQFTVQQFHALPTHCIYVFCVDLRTNSHYFPIQY
jgi:hypothetical protein